MVSPGRRHHDPSHSPGPKNRREGKAGFGRRGDRAAAEGGGDSGGRPLRWYGVVTETRSAPGRASVAQVYISSDRPIWQERGSRHARDRRPPQSPILSSRRGLPCVFVFFQVGAWPCTPGRSGRPRRTHRVPGWCGEEMRKARSRPVCGRDRASSVCCPTSCRVSAGRRASQRPVPADSGPRTPGQEVSSGRVHGRDSHSSAHSSASTGSATSPASPVTFWTSSIAWETLSLAS